MIRTSFLRTCLALSFVCLLCSACTTKDPLYCDQQTPCGAGFHCDLPSNTCEVATDTGPKPDTIDQDASTDLPGADTILDGPPVDTSAPDLSAPDLPAPDAVGDLPLVDSVVAQDQTPDSSVDLPAPDVLAPPKCGDGMINAAPEQCDGSNLNSQTCKTQGYAGGALKCTTSCKLDLSGCYKCGDGKINGSELCDGALLGSNTCKTQGYYGGALKCKINCTLDTAACHDCGNGVINTKEQCDNTQLGGQSCSKQGFDGGTLKCKSNCTLDTAGCHKCGDGKVNGPEQCDGTVLGAKTCKTAGHDGGTLKCKSNCTLDSAGCYKNWTMAAGSGHACGLGTGGKLWCWGAGRLLGIGVTSGMTGYNKPQAVLSGVKQVSVGANHTCVVLTDGTLRCWGTNNKGQLGDGTITTQTLPTKVGSNLNTWASVSVSFSHTCAVKKNGTLWCWGLNNNGQLGDGTKTDRHAPTQVGTANTWQSIATSDAFFMSGYTCGVKKNGTLWCWGDNQNGQHGDGTKKAKTQPTQVGSLSTWHSISAGSGHLCGLRTDGTLWCAGSGGNLGDGTTTSSSVFVKVPSTKKWKSVSANNYVTCGIKSDGTLWCWGYNMMGQIGDGTTKDGYSPAQVGSNTTWHSVSVSFNARFTSGGITCGSQTDGTAWCWGSGHYGQLGDGTNKAKTTPSKVAK